MTSAFDPRMDLKSVIKEHLQEVLQRQMKQMFWPKRLASELLEVQELEEARLIEGMQKIANRISVGVITAGLILDAAMLMRIPRDPI